MNWKPSLLLVVAGSVLPLCGCPRPQVDAVRVSPDNALAIRKALGEGKSAAADDGGASLPQPTGWATIRGKFILEGNPPPRVPLAISKDMQVCAPGGKQVFAEEMVVDDNGGIKDVVIYLTTKIPLDDPAWIHPDYAASVNAEVVFDQKECIFLSHVFAARTTNTILLKNSDPIGHNTNIVGKGSASANVTIASSDETTYVPAKESPEPFDVSCSVHPWMAAKMLIRDTPYFAVTAPDGTFEIKNVPAGVKLDFRVWQERLKFITTVKRDGQDVKWPRRGLPVTLEPDAVEELNVSIPALN